MTWVTDAIANKVDADELINVIVCVVVRAPGKASAILKNPPEEGANVRVGSMAQDLPQFLPPEVFPEYRELFSPAVHCWDRIVDGLTP